MARIGFLISLLIGLFATQSLWVSVHESCHWAEQAQTQDAAMHGRDCQACQAFHARADVPRIVCELTPSDRVEHARADEKPSDHPSPLLLASDARAPPFRPDRV